MRVWAGREQQVLESSGAARNVRLDIISQHTHSSQCAISHSTPLHLVARCVQAGAEPMMIIFLMWSCHLGSDYWVVWCWFWLDPWGMIWLAQYGWLYGWQQGGDTPRNLTPGPRAAPDWLLPSTRPTLHTHTHTLLNFSLPLSLCFSVPLSLSLFPLSSLFISLSLNFFFTYSCSFYISV